VGLDIDSSLLVEYQDLGKGKGGFRLNRKASCSREGVQEPPERLEIDSDDNVIHAKSVIMRASAFFKAIKYFVQNQGNAGDEKSYGNHLS
jgi:hypothetical protein